MTSETKAFHATYRFLGVELEKSLKMFSLDVVGIVAGYAWEYRYSQTIRLTWYLDQKECQRARILILPNDNLIVSKDEHIARIDIFSHQITPISFNLQEVSELESFMYARSKDTKVKRFKFRHLCFDSYQNRLYACVRVHLSLGVMNQIYMWTSDFSSYVLLHDAIGAIKGMAMYQQDLLVHRDYGVYRQSGLQSNQTLIWRTPKFSDMNFHVSNQGCGGFFNPASLIISRYTLDIDRQFKQVIFCPTTFGQHASRLTFSHSGEILWLNQTPPFSIHIHDAQGAWTCELELSEFPLDAALDSEHRVLYVLFENKIIQYTL